jgi:hypothetical protein
MFFFVLFVFLVFSHKYLRQNPRRVPETADPKSYNLVNEEDCTPAVWVGGGQVGITVVAVWGRV